MSSRKLVLRGLIGGALLGAVFRLLLNLFLQMHWGWEEIAIGAATGALLGLFGGMVRARREQLYSDSLSELAREAGFAHTPQPGPEKLALLRTFPLLGLGTLLSARHHLARHDERLAVEMVDLDLGDDDVQLAVMTLMFFPTPISGLPGFWLHPRHPDQGLPGGQGITFEPDADHPDAAAVARFAAAYRLDPDLHALVRADKGLVLGTSGLERICRIFSLDVLRYFADNPGWHVQTHDGRLALWHGERVVAAADRPALLLDALHVHELLSGGRAGVAMTLPASYRLTPRRPRTAVEVVKGVVLGLFVGWLVWLGLTCAVLAAFAPGRGGAWITLGTLIALPLLGGVLGGRWGYSRCRSARAGETSAHISRVPAP
jgi:hypothetical protein